MGYRKKTDDIKYRETPSWLRSFAVGFSLWWDDKGREHAEGVAIVLLVLLTLSGTLCLIYSGVEYNLDQNGPKEIARAVTVAKWGLVLLAPLAISIANALVGAILATAKAGRKHIEFKEIPPRSRVYDLREKPPRSRGYEFRSHLGEEASSSERYRRG